MTDSVDFKITDNGSVSFMTNVSARFWVVQIINESDTGLVESLASDVYKEAIKVPYLATFAIRKVFKLQPGSPGRDATQILDFEVQHHFENSYKHH